MRAIRTFFFALLTAAICLASGGLAVADALQDFDKARSSYEAGRYPEAAERFQAMLGPKSDAASQPGLIERVRIYHAACLIALSRPLEADAQIETILRANPSASPDPVVFPSAVLDRFSDVHARIRHELEWRAAEKAAQEERAKKQFEATKKRESERIAALERQARQEALVVRNSRWVAAVPFGVGQFQNRQTALGWVLLTSETVLAAGSIVTFLMVQSLQSLGNDPGIDRDALNTRVHTVKLINQASFAALMVLAAGGIAHAESTFVPEFRTVRDRPVPKPSITPVADALANGLFLGVQGQF
jgi:hypothetical protein